MREKLVNRLQQMNKELSLLLQDLRGYSNERLNEQPDEESWSVVQILSHLYLAEKGSFNYIKRKVQYSDGLSQTDLGAKARAMLLKFYLKTPFKFKAPEIVDTAGQEASNYWELARRYDDLRKALLAFLGDDLPEDLLRKQLYKHPIAGRTDLMGMLSFFDQHFQRHKKQIYRTLKSIDAVKVN
ncbi:MAG TPA: DinB family protein [Saprospiraceae bacterium]|nr:DinB family protein [Saprospiraceae bacterium]